VQQTDDQFKFTLASKLEDSGLAQRLTSMMQDIQQQGKLISKKHDIKRHAKISKDDKRVFE